MSIFRSTSLRSPMMIQGRCLVGVYGWWWVKSQPSQGGATVPEVDERIQALEAKLKQLKVQQQRSEQRARTIAARRSRHDELRRKILVGAVVLAKVEAQEFDEQTLKRWMDRELTRPDDRALFGWDGK